MIQSSRRLLCWAVVVGVLLGAGCNRSPEAKKARYLERGDAYYSQQKYREAVIEYRNALQIDQANIHAMQRLGLAYFQLGEITQSYPLLLKTKELAPKDTETRLKLGTMFLAGGKPAEAREEAAFVLQQDPKNFEALLLWVGTANTSEELAEAIDRFEQKRADFGEMARFHMALGALYLRKQNPEKAEQAFQEAIAKEPRSIEAHTLLGNFYLAKKDTAQAEREFKIAADIAPAGSPSRITLADLYVLLNRREEAKQVLAEITKEAPDFLPAWRRTAQIALGEKRYEDGLTALDVLLKKNPGDLDGHLLRGQIYREQKETGAAISEFQQVLKLEPKSAPALYQLALTHIQTGDLQQAKAELTEVKANAPNMVDARLLLAELNMRAGATEAAVEDLENVIEQQPKLTQAYVLLGAAYLAKKEVSKATETYRQFSQQAPKDPRGPYFIGVSLQAQGKTGEARKAYADALALGPEFLEPLAQLVALDFNEKKSEAALERVQQQIRLVPQSARFQNLLARVHLARGEGEAAEAAYLKATALDPQLFDSYLGLGHLYAQTKRYDEALAKMEQALTVNPKNISAYMLTGIIHEQRADIPKARVAYEKVLELNPRFGPAANNLAYIYSEHGGDKEKALTLAQTAKELLPEDPRVTDTLAWILYKRGIYERSLSLLKESIEKLGDNAEVQYHYGMALYKTGNRQAAKEALTKALGLSPAFPGAEEAKQTLAELP